jgi:hypothetical protein
VNHLLEQFSQLFATGVGASIGGAIGAFAAVKASTKGVARRTVLEMVKPSALREEFQDEALEVATPPRP